MTGQNLVCLSMGVLLGLSLNHLVNFECFCDHFSSLRQIFLLLVESFLRAVMFREEVYDLYCSAKMMFRAVFWIFPRLASSSPVREEFQTGTSRSAMLLICLIGISIKSSLLAPSFLSFLRVHIFFWHFLQ